MLAKRYGNDPTVIGADLLDEPSGNWGINSADDWARAAKAAGDAIHTVNSKWLIVVEGVRVFKGTWFGGGGRLKPVATMPIKLKTAGQLVCSPDGYPPSLSEQSWFQNTTYPTNLKLSGKTTGGLSRPGTLLRS